MGWDADADRCFLFDETGAFLEGGTLTALLAAHRLEQEGQGVVLVVSSLLAGVILLIRGLSGR